MWDAPAEQYQPSRSNSSTTRPSDRTDLVDVKRQTGDVSLIGYIAALAEQGPTRGPQNVFINRRIVKDRTIAHAIIDAYSVASIKERSPEVHLFIEMPPDAVDVNVHPTKAEVRFRDQSFIHELVRRALGDALGRGPAPELQLIAPGSGQPQPSTLPLPTSYSARVSQPLDVQVHRASGSSHRRAK